MVHVHVFERVHVCDGVHESVGASRVHERVYRCSHRCSWRGAGWFLGRCCKEQDHILHMCRKWEGISMHVEISMLTHRCNDAPLDNPGVTREAVARINDLLG